MRSTDFSFLGGDAEQVAPRLLGCELLREFNGRQVRGRIVETEAYDQQDAASHSYHGSTPRSEVMFGPPGHAYVYFTYGMHYCMNVVTGTAGHGSAVLIRALEPLQGIEIMQAHRPNVSNEHQLTNGPAKLCQALGINREFNSHDLHESPLQLVTKPALSENQIITTTRIGIRQDMHRLWRFFIKENAYVSR